MKLLSRRDIIIIAAALIAAAAVFALTHHAQTGSVNIYVGGELYESVPAGTEKTVVIRQDGGKVNTVEITASGVRMESSTCPNQDCVMKGTLPLSGSGLISDWIICLPNAVSVEVSP